MVESFFSVLVPVYNVKNLDACLEMLVEETGNG